MPGLSFLFKKDWHPLRLKNQKTLFIKEEEAAKNKIREEEAAKEVSRELEIQGYAKAGDFKDDRDPRSSSLKFMYSIPKPTGDQSNDSRTSMAANNIGLQGSIQEDEHVKKFMSKLTKSKYDEEHSRFESSGQINEGSLPIMYQKDEAEKSNRQSKRTNQSSLERELGRKPAKGMTQSELEERHAFLRNAPTEGTYTKTNNVQLHHKPFNEVVRNVKCCRCGEWGHKVGERECLLKDYNPHDWARQKQEDPMSYMNGDLQLEKQKLILKHGISTGTKGASNQEILMSDEEESDPEAEFLATLTPREKQLLLLRLQELETGVKPGRSRSDSSTSDSDSSSSDSSKSDSSDHGRKKKRKKHKHHTKKSEKNKKKRKDSG